MNLVDVLVALVASQPEMFAENLLLLFSMVQKVSASPQKCLFLLVYLHALCLNRQVVWHLLALIAQLPTFYSSRQPF